MIRAPAPGVRPGGLHTYRRTHIPMLDVLRRGASTWISKLLLGLLIVSFGVWGIADVFRGFGSNTAFHVGEREIGVVELDRSYQMELQQLSRRMNRPFNKDEALKTGISAQIIGKIVSEATIAEAAREMRLDVSDVTVRADILRDPAFKGANGAFDRARFVDLMRANGMNEDMYVVRRRADMVRAQVMDGLGGGVQAPKVWAEALDQFRNETRVVRSVTLSTASLAPVGAPTAEELAAFFAERKAQFRTVETRSLVAVVLDPKALAHPEDVSDDDAKVEYQRQKERWITIEKRRIVQIAFDDAAQAEAALAEIKAGKPYTEVAAARGEDAVADLGLLARTGFLDARVAEAAFAIPAVGATSPVLTVRDKPVVLALAGLEPGSEKSFAEVSATIKGEIAAKRAEGEVLARHDQVEDAIAGGAKLAEVGTRFGLPPVEIKGLTRDGKTAAGTAPALPKLEDLVKGAFESDVGVENDPIDLNGHGFMWYALTSVEPSRERTLDEVREQAVAAWTAREIDRRLAAEAKAIIDRVGKGEDFDKVAESLGLTVAVSQPFKRLEKVEGLPTSAVMAAFAGPEGRVASVSGDGGTTHVVLQVAEVKASVFFEGTDEEKALSQQAAETMRTTLLENWLGLVQKDIGVSANRQVIGRVTGQSQN